MNTIEIVDDAGDEFSVMNIPIPFYIRCKLNEGLTKYRVRILDESKHLRSFYTGASKRDFLEVHVPVIPLQEYGTIFIHIELDNDLSNDRITHETSIEYVDQETYESVTGKIRGDQKVPYEKSELPKLQPIIQDTSHQLSSQEVRYLSLGEEETKVNEDQSEGGGSVSLPPHGSQSETDTEEPKQSMHEDPSISESIDQSPELSLDELSYLTQRTEILKEDILGSSGTKILELSDIQSDEEE
ncbi:MAG: hypothetical protein ACW98I_12270 [Candidatus Hodarchaeales archaeon]|jgi:hypothetical protein